MTWHAWGRRPRPQALQKLGARQRQREKKTGKGNKYGAKKADVLLPDGSVKRFASEKEAARFRELDLLQRAGKISRLECQAPFVLLPHQKREDGKAEQPVKYIADFVYWENRRKVVEDVKGYTDTGRRRIQALHREAEADAARAWHHHPGNLRRKEDANRM